VPLGILLPLVRRRTGPAFVVLVGIGLSATIELAQLAISLALGYGYRSADIDDVIVNTAGTVAGLALVLIVRFAARLMAFAQGR
jgi:glycopeptide antibiotics resistance protein